MVAVDPPPPDVPPEPPPEFELEEDVRTKFWATVDPPPRLAVVVNGLKPVAEAVNWYVPAGIFPDAYCPDVLVVMVSSNALVLALPTKWIVAPTITAPVLSVADP